MAKETDISSATLKAFAVLEAVLKADRPISLSEIVEAVKLPKPSVFRILTTLTGAGLVLREPSGKDYTVGHRLARIGLDIMRNNSVRSSRHVILQRLADELEETCNLTMFDGTDVVYIDRVDAKWPLKVDLKPGSRVPAHCSASGKLFLSQLPRAKRRLLLENIELTRYTDRTITHPDLLEAELDRTRANRVGIDNEEYMAGLICVAAPVLDRDGRILASVAVQAPVARLSLARAMDRLPELRRAADALAATFEQPGIEITNTQPKEKARRPAGKRRLPAFSERDGAVET